MMLSDIMTQVRGLSYSKKDSTDVYDEGKIAVLRAGNIYESKIIEKDYVFVPKTLVKEKQYLRRGDILIAASSGSISVVGKAAMVSENMDASFGAFCKVLRPDKDKVDLHYFKHFFETDYYKRTIKSLAEGANINNLKTEHFDNLNIPLPPLEEQKKIAAILDAADDYRQKTKALIDKYDQLTQSLFLEMFGDPVTNPKGWEENNLKNLGKVITGSTPSSKLEGMFGDSIPFITPGDLESKSPVKRHLTQAGATQSRMVRKGSLLLCCIGATIGKKGIASEASCFNQQINAVEWHNQINDVWGFISFTWLKQEVINRSISTTLPILKKSEFELIKMPVPPLELQNKFAERVAQIEKQKQQAEASLVKAEELFSSLLQRAFKGDLS